MTLSTNNNIINTNILETVQLISIFSYLNALSDYLYIENYLTEIDRNKQIPVVNALYEYLEDYEHNQTMKLKLMRHLLKGSDLYGEEENENPDVIFVNAMFDYIIKSLVFDKYGNIYGFLADVVRKTKMLQLNSLFKEIEASLNIATFGNEYGERSTLSSLAANRIFTDIILPLFPQPKIDLDLLSLDYIYAQAGSNFLRAGKINNTYYTDSENFNTIVSDQEHFFDEYLTTGLMLDYYLANENLNLSTLQAFALPALFLYVSTNSVENENITRIVFDPYYWKAAYENLFSHLRVTFIKMKETIKNDTNYQLHRAFSTFQTRFTFAKLYLDRYCQHLSKEEKTSEIPNYLDRPRSYQCGNDYLLPDLNGGFLSYINGVGETYKRHDLKSIMQSFGNSLLRSLKNDEVIIQLLAPNDDVLFGIFNNITRIPYDLFVFYYPKNVTSDFYALIRENYTVTLVREADSPEDFKHKTGLNVQILLNHGYHRVNLKLVNQSMDVFWENIMSYKKQRLESYLKFIDSNFLLGEWWEEFGLSLVPFYPCLVNLTHNQIETSDKNFCQMDDYIFLNLLDKNRSLLLTQKNTRAILASLGTSFKTKCLKNLIDDEILTINKLNVRAIVSPIQELPISQIFEKLSLHIEEPGFQLTSIPKDYLEMFLATIYALQNKANVTFKHVRNIIDSEAMLNFSATRCVDKNTNYSLYVKYRIGAANSGYGYKFIYLTMNRTAELRTDHQLQTKNFISLTDIELDGEKVYSLVKNDTLELNENYTFYINPQLQRIGETALFLGISMHSYNNEKCDIDVYNKNPIPLVECPRQARVMKKWSYLSAAIESFSTKNVNLTRDQIVETMKNYVFPDEGRVELQFLQDWTNNSNLKIPEWAEVYKIDNQALLWKLRIEFHLDDRNLSTHNGTIRINSIYTFRERQKIEARTSLGSIIKNFNDQEARYVTTFEDYYAIRNFATTGYTRITGSTFEANHMKIALYKLAIRQSDDPDDEFDKTLFRIEAMPVELINRILSSRKLYILQKFLITHAKQLIAIHSATMAMPGFENVLFEMKFTKPYLRTKIRLFDSFQENISILLPGTKFSIVKVRQIQLARLGNCLKVELTHNHVRFEKYAGYKNIMTEITRIMSKSE